jgi:hypothetical protein
MFLKRNSKAFHLILQSNYKFTFQNVLSKFGSARYKFGRSYQASSGDKVQKVIKYIDKVPKFVERNFGVRFIC